MSVFDLLLTNLLILGYDSDDNSDDTLIINNSNKLNKINTPLTIKTFTNQTENVIYFLLNKINLTNSKVILLIKSYL